MYSSWAGSVGREVESVLKDDLIRADVETDVQERSMSIECSGSNIEGFQSNKSDQPRCAQQHGHDGGGKESARRACRSSGSDLHLISTSSCIPG